MQQPTEIPTHLVVFQLFTAYKPTENLPKTYRKLLKRYHKTIRYMVEP